MTEDALYFQLRERLGSTGKNQINNRQLTSYVTDALDWMADQLRYRVVTDKTSLLLEAGVQEYLIPDEVAWLIWVEWNTNRITPSATASWDRDGTDWRRATASQPLSYAIQGRNLILLPPPDAASVATQPYLTFRYIAASAPLFGTGPLGLSDLDIWIAVYKSAILYLKAHPADSANAMIQNYEAELEERVPRAKRRVANMIRDYRPHLHVNTSRLGGAR